MIERNIRILDILAAQQDIKVTLLAELLAVSQVTIRKDLDMLEQQGIINRGHGYARINNSNGAGNRIAIKYSIKRRIARVAAKMVEDGETIMLESGSCCALFAEELALAKRNITIITNSAYIVNFIDKLPQIKTILLGGYYLPESQVLVGPITIKCGNILFSDKYFLGTDGFIPEYGFTGRDHLRTETVVGLAERTNKVYILTEADKFYHRGAYGLMCFNKLAGVITDEKIPKEAEAVLCKNNIPVYIVPSQT